MVKLSFYGGVREIGGNKILLEDKGTKIFLDFGMNFGDYADYFTEFMPMRKCNSIKDLTTLGLLPDLKGLYRRDYCKHMGVDCKEDNSVDGVLISHSHIDHIGFVHFLRKDIPVYVSPESKAVMELFDTAGAGGFNDYCKFNPSFEFLKKKNGDGLKRRTARDGVEERAIKTFTFDKPFKIGSMNITPCRVDHSLPGATGYIIETSEGNLIYTGDLRFHGRHKYWSDEFVDKARQAEPNIMLTEGTRISSVSARTEEYVENESTKLIKDKKGVVIANFPIRDTDRLLTFYKTAVKNNRTLVIESRQAMLLDFLKAKGETELPDSNDNNIKILTPKKGWGLIGREDVPDEQVLSDYQSWEKEYISRSNVITADEISKNQQKYLVFMNYFQLNNLIDIKPNKDSVHIRSICEPFNEDMELDEKRINNWLNKFNLTPKHQIHASGHASGAHLFKMIEAIQPKTLIPIHTEQPELYKEIHNNVKIIEKNRTYDL
ncbi:MAG: MBL fold metallo-hydrolase [Candidatus Nanoarchaeia archaeon]|jgi:ribonuclease J